MKSYPTCSLRGSLLGRWFPLTTSASLRCLARSAVLLAGWLVTSILPLRAAEFFVVQANGAGGAHTTVNAAIAAAIASSGGASGDTIEIRSNTAGTLQVFAQTIDLSNVNISSTDEADWLTIRVRAGDKARFRTSGTLLGAAGTSRGWKVEGNSLGPESLQFGDRADFVHTGLDTYQFGSYPQTHSANIASTCSNYAIRNVQLTGARNYSASIFDGTDYELSDVAAYDQGTNHYDIHPNSGLPQDWGDLVVVRGVRVRLLNVFGEHGGHNGWKVESNTTVVRNSDFSGYWGDISPSPGARAMVVETVRTAPAPYGPVMLEGVIVRDTGNSIDNSFQAAMKTEGNRVIIRDSFFFDIDSHLWQMNFANAKQANTSYFSGHAFYHNTSYISKGTWWNNFNDYNPASGDAQLENNLIANNLFQQLSDNDKSPNPAQILEYNTSQLGANGFSNGFHGTVISGNAVGGPSPLKRVNLRTSGGNTTFAIDTPPSSPVNLTGNVFDNVITTVTFDDVGSFRSRTKSGFAVANWGSGASAGDAPPLTTITGNSSGTVIEVENARPFFDGWNIRGEAGDYLYIGSTAGAAESAGEVQIASINYTTHEITLTATRSVTAGQGVWFGGNPANGSASIRRNRGAFIPGSGSGGGGGSSTFDANALSIAAISSGDTTSTVSNASASNGNFLRLDANAANDFVTFDVIVPTTDTYDVSVGVHRNAWRGIFQLAIDNGSGFVNLGSPQDTYAAAAGFAELDLGSVALTAGTRQFRFTVTGKNASSADYEVGLDHITLTPAAGTPEVNVTGNSVTIVSGDATPQIGDNTDFGNADILTGSVLKDFTIHNTGTASLTVGTLTGGGDFGVYTAPPGSVASGNSVNFTIAFVPTATGLRTATISVANNDSDENPYTFTVQGTGINGGPRVSDAFTDTHLTGLGSHTPNLDVIGSGWSVPGSNAQIAGNALQILTDNSPPVVIAAGASDAEVIVDYTPVSGSRDGLIARHVDANNSFELNAREPNGDLRLLNISGGTLNVLDSASFSWNPSQTYELKLVVDGTSITGYVDGTPLVSATASAHSSATSYGLRRRSGEDDTRFDNFEVNSLGGAPVEYTLTLNTSGQGTIQTDPSGTEFEEDTEVELTAIPASGWLFAGWSGDLSGAANPENVVMTANRSVTATFEQDPLRVSDTFTDTNLTSLTSHAPDVDYEAGGWSAPDSNAQITANSLQLLTNDSAPVIVDAGISNAVVTVAYTPVSGSRDGLVARYVDGNNYFELNAREPNGDLRLLIVSGGSMSVLDTDSFSWTATQTYQLKLVVNGSSITGYVDDVPLVSATSSSHATATAHGLRRRSSNDGSRFDNFTVEEP